MYVLFLYMCWCLSWRDLNALYVNLFCVLVRLSLSDGCRLLFMQLFRTDLSLILWLPCICSTVRARHFLRLSTISSRNWWTNQNFLMWYMHNYFVLWSFYDVIKHLRTILDFFCALVVTSKSAILHENSRGVSQRTDVAAIWALWLVCLFHYLYDDLPILNLIYSDLFAII